MSSSARRNPNAGRQPGRPDGVSASPSAEQPSVSVAMSATLPPLRMPANFNSIQQPHLLAAMEPRSFAPQTYPSQSPCNRSVPEESRYTAAPQTPQEAGRLTPRLAYQPAVRRDSTGESRSSRRLSGPSASAGSPQLVSRPISDYRLVFRQQAEVARACGFGDRDRRVLDPPPILECVGSVGQYLHRGDDEVMGPTFIAHASLWNAEGTEDVTTAAQPDRPSVRLLVGSLVSSGAAVKDEQGRKGLFFTFADLSCRSSGRFRLRFSLIRIDPATAAPGTSAPILDHVMSEPFDVYSAKDFPGMRRATPLTRVLKEQGVPIPAKKSRIDEPRKRRSPGDSPSTAPARLEPPTSGTRAGPATRSRKRRRI